MAFRPLERSRTAATCNGEPPIISMMAGSFTDRSPRFLSLSDDPSLLSRISRAYNKLS